MIESLKVETGLVNVDVISLNFEICFSWITFRQIDTHLECVPISSRGYRVRNDEFYTPQAYRYAGYDQLLRTVYNIFPEESEKASNGRYYERYLETRVQDFICSHSKDFENETRKSDPSKTDLAAVTGSASTRERTRSCADILASALDPRGNKYLYNRGIRYLGVENFLSIAAQFCREEAQGGKIEIVSIGCGDGHVERNILAAYRACFENPSRLDIILVDPDEKYRSEIHFKYVDDLIDASPRIVGNCVLFIFCPLPDLSNNGYDIESVRKLKPKAVLSEYDATGVSGSREFVRFLDPEGPYGEKYSRNCGLDYYPIREIALQVKTMGMDIRLIKVKK